MIDLDLLDEQLEHALTDEVRMLRGPTLRRTAAAPPAPPAPRREETDWDLDALWAADPSDPPAPEADVGPVPPPPKAPVLVTAPRPVAMPVQPPPPPPTPVTRPQPATGPGRPTAATAAPRRPQPPRATGPSRPTAAPAAPRRRQPQPATGPSSSTRSARPGGPSPVPGSPLDRLRQAAAAMNGPDGAQRDTEIADEASRIPELVARNELALADQHIANHAALTAERGSTDDRAAAATWETMRALLDGRSEDARDGIDAVRRLGQRVGPVANAEREWTLRFWVGLEWGSDAEQFALLDYCRERSYRYGELTWRGALTLQLARMGRAEEAAREFDAVAADLTKVSLDVLTSLAEAAFLMRDGRRAALLERPLAAARATLVVAGPAWVCKGSIVRFNAHVAAAKGDWNHADQWFATALRVHRRLRAQPLVARTLHEWGMSLRGRNDDLARQYLDESAELAAGLGLTGLSTASAVA